MSESQGKVYFGKRNKDIVVPEGHKRCTRCERTLLKTSFGKCVSKKDGLQSHCNECRQAKRDEKRKPKEVIPEGLKRCYKCKELKPATMDYFSADNRSPGGLQAACKRCYGEYREQNRERINNQKRQHYFINAIRINAANMHNYYARHDYYREKNRKWYYENQDHVREYRRTYYHNNREQLLEAQRIWRVEHPEQWQNYYHKNKERLYQSKRKWAEANRPMIRMYAKVAKARRRALKRQLPYDWGIKYWRNSLDYWGHQCCICGQAQHLQADHWIPLSHANCPGTTTDNMIVLCRSCNASKGTTMPEYWLTEKLGEEAAQKKIAEIQAYFAYVSELQKEE